MGYLTDDKRHQSDLFRSDEEKIEWIVRRLDDPSHPLPSTNMEADVPEREFADNSLADAAQNVVRRPTGRNNRQIGNSFDRSSWAYLERLDEQKNVQSFTTGDTIGIEASSVAFPPTNQFRIAVLAIPLNPDGSPQTAASTPQWTAPVSYSSGFTGAFKNQLVIQADPPIGSLYRWTVSIPPQQSAHDNASSNLIQIYAPR